MGNIIAAINAFTQTTGVEAQHSSLNAERVEIFSTQAGGTAFVSAEQLSWTWWRIFNDPIGGTSANQMTDYGEDGVPGDVNCDGLVDIADLLAVLEAWGNCPAPPELCPADLNGDGMVNVTDLLFVLDNWT